MLEQNVKCEARMTVTPSMLCTAFRRRAAGSIQC